MGNLKSQPKPPEAVAFVFDHPTGSVSL